MNNKNFHPILNEPPIAHALHKWDEENRILTYEYNGRNIITMEIGGDDEVGFRHGSDGNLQNIPFVQQLYVMLDRPIKSKVTLLLSSDAINMKPNRAKQEEAIIGQVGRPTMNGVNGVYDINQDLLIDWNGCDWRWISEKFEENEDKTLKVELEIELGPKPLFINLRMQYYRKHLGYSYHKPWEFRPNLKPLTGWCSWEAFRRDVTQENIEEVSKFFGKHLRDYGLEYIQIDDGFQNMPLPLDPKGSLAEGWLNTNKQFPKGHSGAVKSIEEEGLKAGIWTNANITNEEFAKEQSQFLIKGNDGKPMIGEWIDYLIDCSEEALDKHIAPFYKGLKGYGYDYFKTDAIRHLLLDGLHEAVRQGLMTNEDAENKFRAYMKCARENIGDDAYFLASWGILSEVVGLVDACRIAMDANPTWAGIRMQIVESARWFHTQRILFLIDPDHICARTNIEWARSICSLVSLSGGLYMLSDPLENYDKDRLDIIQRTLPTLKTFTGETGNIDLTYPAFTWTKLHGFAVPRENPVATEDITIEDAINMAGNYESMDDNHPFSSLWNIHIDREYRRWSILGRFATVPLKESNVYFKDLGLDNLKEYLAFDFWEKKYLGRIKESINCRALDLGNCQIISLTEVKEHPQVIASTRHVSMDDVSIKSQNWINNTLILDLEGIKNTKEEYVFHIPKGYTVENIKSTNSNVSYDLCDELLKVIVEFDHSDAKIEIEF
ncbi:alpha-galactosidase [[Clostridium] dakarense]|uniref:alpha-galactosidase n=1 Tax=Faecalimicrobium dakarense TaxID=1301100 RepID=UPI0004B34FAB|nr:alpha-galactosidase [[Clostridium] dakarense]